MATAILAQETLKSLMHYDPDTGVFTWKVAPRRGISAGSIAGVIKKDSGYVLVGVSGKEYRAHRLAWLYVFGEFPPYDLDHINRNRSDNRIDNLRMATRAENMQNGSKRKTNTSGHVGVRWYSQAQKWKAEIGVNYKNISLGYHSNLEQAIAARKAGELKYHTFQHAFG